MKFYFAIPLVATALFPLAIFVEEPREDSVVTVEVVKDKINKDVDLVATPTPTPTITEEAVPEVATPSQEVTQVETPQANHTSPTEGVQDRLNRLASSMGISYPVVANDCYIPGYDPTAIRGCYLPGSYYISITKYALIYDDSYVSCIISHEARHLWQDLNGLYDIQNGIIVNRDWLEADATAYSGCS